MYTRFILMQLSLLVIFILNFFIFPLLSYPFRRSIVKYPNFWKWAILYWFSDDSETWGETDDIIYMNNWYGVYEIYNRDYTKFKKLNWFNKYMLSLQWGVVRNPNWNFQIYVFSPKNGIKYDINEISNYGGASIWNWRDYADLGKQHVTWKVNYDGKTKTYFRYSFSEPMGKYNVVKIFSRLASKLGEKTGWFSTTEKQYMNFMAGTGNSRFILKMRFFNPSEKSNVKTQYINDHKSKYEYY